MLIYEVKNIKFFIRLYIEREEEKFSIKTETFSKIGGNIFMP